MFNRYLRILELAICRKYSDIIRKGFTMEDTFELS